MDGFGVEEPVHECSFRGHHIWVLFLSLLKFLSFCKVRAIICYFGTTWLTEFGAVGWRVEFFGFGEDVF